MISKINKTERFIQKAVFKHGDKYSYKNTIYIKAHSNIMITCKQHGDFEQSPTNHLAGKGCNKCGTELTTKIRSHDNCIFIKNAKRIHGDKYNYEKVNYINAHIKITITCLKHGQFKQSPTSHLNKNGCPKCKGEGNRERCRHNRGDFIKMATVLHGCLYNYDKVKYVNAHTNVLITCIKHGDFKQTPSNHLQPNNCPKCVTTGFNKFIPAILYYIRIETIICTVWKIGVTNRSVNERFPGSDWNKITVISEIKLSGLNAYSCEQFIIKLFSPWKYKGDSPLINVGTKEMFTHDITRLHE